VLSDPAVSSGPAVEAAVADVIAVT
jgi:hypothetical protein